MDLFKDKIHFFVLKYWSFLSLPQSIDISNIKLLFENNNDIEYDIDLSDIDED
tara:strand:- start:289 stop:447 length:159 start_codon:yes stop_codon:yes gene_type:complete